MQTAVREALRTSREADAQRDELQQHLQQQHDAVAAAEAAAVAAQTAAEGARQEAQQQVLAEFEALKQERGGSCGVQSIHVCSTCGMNEGKMARHTIRLLLNRLQRAHSGEL
jgi:predicted  nucleic acid-binding Zn-ribbon protein